MSGAIEALHIYDEHNKPILSHIYASRPLSADILLPLYLAHPKPRPSLIYLPNTHPPTLVFSLSHANLLFLLTSSSELEPLLALEFLHRIIDIFEDFLGAPLLSSKIENNCDVVAQLLNEMCDAGAVSTTEGNALRDLVEVEGWMGKISGMLNLPGKSGFPSSTPTTSMQGISSHGASNTTPALPWRRANVRHTSNELYVDIIESISVTIAPSGRPLSAFSYGTIAFTSKISGVPDLLLTLTSPSGKHNLPSIMELPVFHPCVRLARWKSSPGELSFIPPDGRFILAGYEVDLLPDKLSQTAAKNLSLPVNLEVKTSLGNVGAEFEVRVILSKIAGTNGNSTSSSLLSSSSSSTGSRPSALGRGTSGFGSREATSASPLLEDLIVTVPIPRDVRNLSDIRASRGETTYSPGDAVLEWRITSKETGTGVATLRCTVVPVNVDDDDDEAEANRFSFEETNSYEYNEETTTTYQSPASSSMVAPKVDNSSKDRMRVERLRLLMPSSARVSFAIKGWLPSGIKVDGLIVDKSKSRGLGDGVKPYKGVKYLCVSRGGVEVRC